MLNSTYPDCCHPPANEGVPTPSFTSWGGSQVPSHKISPTGGISLRLFVCALIASALLTACGPDTSAPKSAAASPADTKPAEPAVPEEIQSAAQSLLGVETQVLLFGDLAKTGNQQFLAANVVPKTPKNDNLAGTIITRAVIAENQNGQWTEIFRCDEHLKNAKGYLGLTPLSDVSGWRIAYEQDAVKGLQLYLTPLKGSTDTHNLPIGVRWNPAIKRYQSLDRTYEHFLVESPTMGGTPKSTLR
jgi:hypothetical protein